MRPDTNSRVWRKDGRAVRNSRDSRARAGRRDVWFADANLRETPGERAERLAAEADALNALYGGAR